jgi:hypothetical protein
VHVELSFVEDLLHYWDVPGITTGGEAMDVDEEAREEVMRRAIVVIHGNMAGVTWVASHAHVIFVLPSRLRRSSWFSRGSRAPPLIFCNLAVLLRSALARGLDAIH